MKLGSDTSIGGRADRNRREINRMTQGGLVRSRHRLVQHGSEVEYSRFQNIYNPEAQVLVVKPDGNVMIERAQDIVERFKIPSLESMQ